MEIFVQGEHKRKFITRNLSPKFSIIPSQFFPPNNIPTFNLVVREVFETPHNELKCVLSITESYSIEENGSKFSHLLAGRAEVADPRPPPPYCQPDRKISVFFCLP